MSAQEAVQGSLWPDQYPDTTMAAQAARERLLAATRRILERESEPPSPTT